MVLASAFQWTANKRETVKPGWQNLKRHIKERKSAFIKYEAEGSLSAFQNYKECKKKCKNAIILFVLGTSEHHLNPSCHGLWLMSLGISMLNIERDFLWPLILDKGPDRV